MGALGDVSKVREGLWCTARDAGRRLRAVLPAGTGTLHGRPALVGTQTWLVSGSPPLWRGSREASLFPTFLPSSLFEEDEAGSSVGGSIVPLVSEGQLAIASSRRMLAPRGTGMGPLHMLAGLPGSMWRNHGYC